jgi:hypothetical protein
MCFCFAFAVAPMFKDLTDAAIWNDFPLSDHAKKSIADWRSQMKTPLEQNDYKSVIKERFGDASFKIMCKYF